MIIPDEFVIPGLAMLGTIFTGSCTWYINKNKQDITTIKESISDVKEQIDLHEISIHESRVRRQSDVNIMSSLIKNMEALSEKITQLRIEMQNKQPRL